MKKTLKKYREIKQLTQQELAEKSDVSVRTIQRIEKNLSEGSPFVIKSICKALQIDIESLEINSTEQENYELPNKDIENHIILDTKKVKNINFSSFLVLILPFLNLIFPSLLYLIYKKSLIDKQSPLQIINFQIIWTFGTLATIIFIPRVLDSVFGIREYSGYPSFIWLYIICVFINVIITLDTANSINKKKIILPYIPKIL